MREEWSIGVIQQSIQDVVLRGIVGPIHWVEPDPWRILADPFCYRRDDGRYVVLAENMNHWIGRGDIWAAILPDNGKLQTRDFVRYARSAVHLSYPFCMKENGKTYFTVESYESGGLHLWRTDHGEPVYVKRLLQRPVVDATFHWDGTYWWLFCTFGDDQANARLHIYYSRSLLGDWLPHRANPVKEDLSSARPGGQLFNVGGRLIRPAQDCSKTYGGALILLRVMKLTPEEFAETPIRVLKPNDQYFCDGLHTIAGAGEMTVIDGKRCHDGVTDLARRVIAKGFKTRRLATDSEMAQRMRFASLPG